MGDGCGEKVRWEERGWGARTGSGGRREDEAWREDRVRGEKVECGQRGRGAELTIITGSRRWTRS